VNKSFDPFVLVQFHVRAVVDYLFHSGNCEISDIWVVANGQSVQTPTFRGSYESAQDLRDLAFDLRFSALRLQEDVFANVALDSDGSSVKNHLFVSAFGAFHFQKVAARLRDRLFLHQ